MTYAALMLCIGLVAGLAGHAVHADMPSFFGKWVVGGFSLAPISAVSESEAAAMIGAKADFAADSAEFGSLRCTRPTYQQTFDAERKLPRIAIDCTNDTIMPYLYILPDTIDASLDGAIYHLKRPVKRPAAPAGGH